MSDTLQDKLKKTQRDLAYQTNVAKKWFGKVQKIHSVVQKCGIHSSIRGGSKPGNVMGVGGLGMVNNFMHSIPPESGGAEQALLEIIEIIET